MLRPSYASVALHYGFCSWLSHLEFEDKRSWLICLLHVSVASGPRDPLKPRAEMLFFLSFPPQQPRVCWTRRRTAWRWEAFRSEGNAWPLALACWNVQCLRPFFAKMTVCILHFNILIHGQSLLAAGIDCWLRISKAGASLLFLWHSCRCWIAVDHFFNVSPLWFCWCCLHEPRQLSVESPDVLNPHPRVCSLIWN